MSEVNWKGVAVYAVVITVIVFLFVGFSGESEVEDDVFSSLEASSYDPVTHLVQVRVSSDSISPSRIDARLGDTVVLRARGVDGEVYRLVEPVYGIDFPISSSATWELSFVANRSGEFFLRDISSARSTNQIHFVVTK